MNTLKSELRKLEKNKHLAYIKFKEERSKLFEAGDWDALDRLQFEFKADEIEIERQIAKLEDIISGNIDDWAKVAIICETSGTLRELFREAGHETISCDVLPADDLSPNDRHHWQGDAVEFLEGFEDGHFSLIIAHPPCTALALSGNRWYGQGMEKHAKRLEAMQWTVDLWNLAKRKAKRVAFENPVGVLGHTEMGKASFYVQPWEHGVPESKKTGFWTWNLPKLKPTCILPKPECGYWENQTPSGQNKLGPSPDRWKVRSKTYMNIGLAIRDQFSKIL